MLGWFFLISFCLILFCVEFVWVVRKVLKVVVWFFFIIWWNFVLVLFSIYVDILGILYILIVMIFRFWFVFCCSVMVICSVLVECVEKFMGIIMVLSVWWVCFGIIKVFDCILWVKFLVRMLWLFMKCFWLIIIRLGFLDVVVINSFFSGFFFIIWYCIFFIWLVVRSWLILLFMWFIRVFCRILMLFNGIIFEW